MKTVRVDLRERSYAIHIGTEWPELEALRAGDSARLLIVTDANVDPLYGGACESRFRSLGWTTGRAVVPPGEETKSLEWAGRLLQQAAEAGLDRRSAIVGLGGGMVGDLAGFVAATYMRGTRLVQAPTTLLAMVDSSVGGKTAVNLPQGKNLVGVFHQPVAVLANLETLRTVPEREYRSGLAEVVKAGVIWDAVLFGQIEENVDRLVARDLDVLENVVARCCQIKAEVVAMDERESGVRAILNFGHTLAHALEMSAGYGSLLHGEAVAFGMAYAARLSVEEKGLDTAAADRVVRLLAKCGLPVAVKELGLKSVPTWERLRQAMSLDKKSVGSRPRWVLAERLGAVAYGCVVPEAKLDRVFRELA